MFNDQNNRYNGLDSVILTEWNGIQLRLIVYANLRKKRQEIEKGREKVGIELDFYYGNF